MMEGFCIGCYFLRCNGDYTLVFSAILTGSIFYTILYNTIFPIRTKI
ncbi:hypothetical protein HMPREF1548_01880 [Clostridium sp. KLE 1755]|nr:hypothetical protein HMPREF1548_01880 [Clostridium sp. KLE 1755]